MSTAEARSRFAESVAASQDADYFEDYDHVSASMLKVLAESPQRYHEQFIARTLPGVETEAMRFGRLFHTAILEPDKFRTGYIVAPKCDRRTTDGKKRWADFCAEHRDKQIIDIDDMATLTAMQASARKHKDVAMLLDAEGIVEQPIRWEDRLWRKGKPDKVIPKLGVIIDPKSVENPTPQGFASAVAKFRWYLQPPMYQDGCHGIYDDWFRFLFIAVGKKPPHEVGVYELTTDDAEWADEKCEGLVTELLTRTSTADWQAPWQREINTVPLPAWVRSNYYDVEER